MDKGEYATMNVPKVTGVLIGLFIGLLAGFYLATEVLGHLPDYPRQAQAQSVISDLRVNDYNDTRTLKVKHGDGSTWNGEHHALQPAMGYRVVQPTYNPQLQ